jgi:hypothetical protein
MKYSKLKIFSLFPCGFLLAGFLYSGIYLYFRYDNWIEHNDFSKYINYSTGFVYNGHKVHLMSQYEGDYHFAPVEVLTRPGRCAEEKFWEIKQPKGSPYPEHWKLPAPDKDWQRVLQIGKSRSITAYSELQRISAANQTLPSGKLAATMIKLWDPQLRTFIRSEPRAIIDLPSYAINKIGHYQIRVVVTKDGKVGRARIFRTGEIEKSIEEIIQYTLYCPAKDGFDYLESAYEYQIWACG